MALVYRSVKGQALTSAEADENFRFLRENDDGLLLPKTQNKGILVDVAAPDFPWHDLRSDMVLAGDVNDPTFVTYQGNIRQLQFDVLDEVSTVFHLPHDYAMGTDIFIHVHWSHNSGIITTGDITGNFEVSYAKGHDQASFNTPVVLSLNNIPASLIRYQHIITEGQLSAALGAGGLLNTANLEPDGLLLCRLQMTANTMDGGAKPFVHAIDIHYQSTAVGTKQKTPDFWT